MFKDIPGYEGLYQVSKCGKIFSCYTRKILKQSSMSAGYLAVSLCKDGGKKTETIHRLVALTYLENTKELRSVNHIDGDKRNNHVNNLEWISAKENTQHAIRLGLLKVHGEEHHFYGKKHSEESKRKISEARIGKMVGASHPRSYPVAKVDVDTNRVVEIYVSQREAAKVNGLSQGNIGMVLSGKRKTTGGYSWRRA